jgi:hypothetical protein
MTSSSQQTSALYPLCLVGFESSVFAKQTTGRQNDMAKRLPLTDNLNRTSLILLTISKVSDNFFV